MFTRLSLTAAYAVLLSSFATTAFGHGGGGDIAVYSTNGQADIGFATLDEFDISQTSFDGTDRVFQAILTPLTELAGDWDLGADEPGFDANEGQLPIDAVISWNVVSIKHWDGQGAVDFTPTTDVVGGYDPAVEFADENGGFHAHPFFGLNDNTDDGLPIANGVYLTEMTISVTGLLDSDPFYLLALVDDAISSLAVTDSSGEVVNMDDAIAAAESLGEQTRDYLAGTSTSPPMLGNDSYAFYADAIAFVEAQAIPEPGAAALALLSLVGLASRRR